MSKSSPGYSRLFVLIACGLSALLFVMALAIGGSYWLTQRYYNEQQTHNAHQVDPGCLLARHLIQSEPYTSHKQVDLALYKATGCPILLNRFGDVTGRK